MKKILLVFSVLLIAFCGIWIFKAQTPVNRPDDADVVQGNAWWENTNIPQPDPDWILDPEIPANYIPVPGEDELYMVVDESGKITEYRHRTWNEEKEQWEWETVNPDIPDNYEPVDGLKDVYKVTDKNGKVRYFKYIRNDDDTFAFVEVDKDGKELQPEKPENEDSNVIPQNYIRVKGNIYAVYNEHGVCIGYKERCFDEKTEKYYWVDAEKPKEEVPKPSDPSHSVTIPPIENPPTSPTSPSTPTKPNDPTTPTEPSNDTFTQTEVITSTAIKGGWVITYETKITRVYTAQKVLLSTKKEGPVEVSRRKLTDDDDNVPDPSKIANTLQKEYARVSVGLAYRDDLAQEVLDIINIDRAAAGVPLMRIDQKSNIQILSDVRAADMAIYNHSEYDSPMYGTASQLCTRFGISVGDLHEALSRRGSATSAQEIASYLQFIMKEKILTEDVDSVGLSIVSKNGYLYVDFIISA